MKKLVSYFIKGLLVFVPIALTIFLLYWVFTNIDSAVNEIFPFFNIPGFGILVMVVIIIIIGFT